MRRWRNGKRAQALNLEAAGSNPARSTHGPIVYGLGSEVFTLGNGVRLPVGLPRGGVIG